MGNEEHVLPPGLVCDKCNNYFGRKIEHTVFGSGYFQNLRARQYLTSRAGNPLAAKGVTTTGGAIFETDYFPLDRSVFFEPYSIDQRVRIGEALARLNRGTIWLPRGGQEPDTNTLSRFFAKIGLEIVAYRLLRSADFETILYDAQLDLLRNWARFGSGTLTWPLHRRRIYGEDRRFIDGGQSDSYQLLHEFDLLITEQGEWYAVICLFGEEFSINLGGPDSEGYEAWLKAHGNASPLYSGRNPPLPFA